nr:hypothetical protein [Micromonospora kangleipakensis]
MGHGPGVLPGQGPGAGAANAARGPPSKSGSRRSHASAYQDPELLDAVRPSVALVPVGAGNDYGHPNPGLLARLSRAGARVLRTDTDGDIAVVRDRRGLAVVTRGTQPGRQP